MENNDKSKSDHKKFHGSPTVTSPSIEDYENNPERFEGTEFEQALKQSKSEINKVKEINIDE
ncbi:hypothetical protein [Olleya sp. Bg11-27]|uniref:hypothetical protein n=1 Tax=Olleya sp. Bg11-27 TaxID=2058135 RepID=UPI000C310E6B|nr:hypothetical protein [Olleya sp. Bg11-27]AUC77553.1 hypothetical protein CW732_18450 [Olleya sp. Bg11-27]